MTDQALDSSRNASLLRSIDLRGLFSRSTSEVSLCGKSLSVQHLVGHLKEQLELDYQQGGDINKKFYPPSLSVQHLVGQIEKEGSASDLEDSYSKKGRSSGPPLYLSVQHLVGQIEEEGSTSNIEGDSDTKQKVCLTSPLCTSLSNI